MKNITWLIVILFTSCNNNDVNNKSTKPITKADSLKLELLGEWGGLGEDSPVWEIRSDSIYYFRESKAYPYQILDNNFIIERSTSKGILKNISVVVDTMTFNDEQGLIIKSYRFKKQTNK